jgi:hypothetical protein
MQRRGVSPSVRYVEIEFIPAPEPSVVYNPSVVLAVPARSLQSRSIQSQHGDIIVNMHCLGDNVRMPTSYSNKGVVAMAAMRSSTS